MVNNIEVSVILPTYNERDNIKVIIPQIEDVFRGLAHEIIVVDDNSPDGTGHCVLGLNERYGNIRLITRRQKTGIGAALREGYFAALGKIILSCDADLSFSVRDMLKLVSEINAGYDLVLGCRHNLCGSYYEIRNLRTVIKGNISRLGNIVLRLLTGINIHDFSANFRAIRNEVWQELNTQERTNIMLFEMIIKAKHQKRRIAEVPVSFGDRICGESKLRLSVEIPKFMIKMFYYIFKYR